MLIVAKPFHSSLKVMSQQLLRMTIARPFDTKGQPLELRNEASVEVQKNSSSTVIFIIHIGSCSIWSTLQNEICLEFGTKKGGFGFCE